MILFAALAIVKILVNNSTEAAGNALEDALENTGLWDPGCGYYRINTLRFLSGTAISAIPRLADKLQKCVSIDSDADVEIETIEAAAFATCPLLASVSLPSVKSLGDGAFMACGNLSAVEFPNVVTIGWQAFAMTALASVSLPNAEVMGAEAFFMSVRLVSASIPKVREVLESTFRSCAVLAEVSMESAECLGEMSLASSSVRQLNLPNLKQMGRSCCSLISLLATVEIPNVTAIPESCFSFCYDLTTVSCSELTAIGDYAFQMCTGLTKMSLAQCVSIGVGAFSHCMNDISWTEPALPKLRTVGERGFEFCKYLLKFTAPALETIGARGLHYCTLLTRVEVSKLKDAGPEVFLNCKELMVQNIQCNQVVIPSYIYDSMSWPTETLRLNSTHIRAGAFRKVSGISVLYLAKVQELGANAFEKNVDLTQVIMPNVEVISAGCFSGCASLTSVTLTGDNHANVTLASEVFFDCAKLTALDLTRVVFVGSRCFTGCHVTDFRMDSLVYIDEHAFEESLIRRASFPTVATFGNNSFAHCGQLQEISLPLVQYLPERACYNCTSLTRIDMKLVFIYTEALAFCASLTELDVSNVSVMAGHSFEGCVSIKSIVFPVLRSISGDRHFSGCTSLEYISLAALAVVPQDSPFVFANCSNLKRIDLPSRPPEKFSDNVFVNTNVTMTGDIVPITLCLGHEDNYASYQETSDSHWKHLSNAVPDSYLTVCAGYAEANGRSLSRAGGIAIGCIVALIVVGAAIFVIWYVRKKRRADEASVRQHELTRSVISDFG